MTAKRNPAHWLMPKGHVEAGESLETTALREAHEEAGITGSIVAPAGALSFTLGEEHITVQYFVVATDDEGTAEEGRRLAWCSYEDALARLTFADTRRLLLDAWPAVLRHFGQLDRSGETLV